jgi:deoxycytidine triphosphate deaminase
MYLSDRDIRWAIATGALILPKESKVDPTSVDLRLDAVEQAKVWDIAKYETELRKNGTTAPELRLGTFKYVDFAADYLVSPPTAPAAKPVSSDVKVYRDGNRILVRPGGFLLWQTKEKIGTPETNPSLICFIDGKSTRARTGILVHFTAPTIHAGWSGQVVLEIANLGPFVFVLQEDDVIAQLTVAKISSSPEASHRQAGSSTHGQTDPGGSRPVP